MNEIERAQIDGELLRSFLTIAKVGSLTVAAARLHRTQSAVSVRLARLEAALGATLFIRAPSGMRLTAAGERFIPAASVALDALQTAATFFAEPLPGTVHVSLPDDYEDAVFEKALARFTQTHPEAAVQATSGCTSSYRAAIARGDMDVAVVSGLEPAEGEPLGVTETVWAAHANLSLDATSLVPLAVMDRTGLRGLAWTGSTTEQHRRADYSWPHNEARQQILTNAFCPSRAGLHDAAAELA